MLAREKLDVVDVAVPHFLHEKMVTEAAAAGVHVITEKPRAASLEEADRMIEACDKAGVRLLVFHNYRYNPPVAKALELVKEGAIGRPFFARFERLSGSHWHGIADYDSDWRTKVERSGGGCLLDNGYHDIYIIREMMASPAVSVYAVADTYFHDISVEDLAVVVFRFANGTTAVVEKAWGVPARGASVQEVHGTKGSIVMGHEDHPLGLYSASEDSWSHPEPGPELEARANFAGAFPDSIAAIADGTPAPTDGAEARRNLEAIAAAYESARTRSPVEVNIPPPD
jgi:predicted dehydrogenase